MIKLDKTTDASWSYLHRSNPNPDLAKNKQIKNCASISKIKALVVLIGLFSTGLAVVSRVFKAPTTEISSVSYSVPRNPFFCDISNSHPASRNPFVCDISNSIPKDFPERSKVSLPSQKEFLQQWKDIGINWVNPIQDNAISAEAYLPKGWSISFDSDPRNQVLRDNKGLPRATMFIKNEIWDPFASVNFLTEEQSISEFNSEQEAVTLEQIRKKETTEKLEYVLQNRKESWSEEAPFGVFFIKDMSRFQLSGYAQHPQYRSCHGFFATKELADTAKKLLEKNKNYGDSIFTEYVDQTNLHLINQGGYKTMNGFADAYWWNTRIW